MVYVFRVCPAIVLGLRELVVLVHGYPDSALLAYVVNSHFRFIPGCVVLSAINMRIRRSYTKSGGLGSGIQYFTSSIFP